MIQERKFRKLSLSDLELVLQMGKDFRSGEKTADAHDDDVTYFFNKFE
ncbi:MAG: hypothetical protein WDA24_00620 [Tissierellales bacterium]